MTSPLPRMVMTLPPVSGPRFGIGPRASGSPSRGREDFTLHPFGSAIDEAAAGTGVEKAMVVWRTATHPHRFVVGTKSASSQLTAWGSASFPAAIGSGIVSGPSLEYSEALHDWTYIYLR